MVQEGAAAGGKDAGAAAAEAPSQAISSDAPGVDVKPYSPSEAMSGVVSLLEKSVKNKETRLVMGRLMRATALLRAHMRGADLVSFVRAYLPEDSASAAFLLPRIKQDAAPSSKDASSAAPMDADDGGAPAAEQPTPAPAAVGDAQPEVELYLHLLLLVRLLDAKDFDTAREVGDTALALLRSYNRRTLDVIGSRLYFYTSWAYECSGNLEALRGTLMSAHCSAVLRHDAVGAETLLNLLLRNYLAYGLYDQAEKFRSKAQVGDTWRVAGQYCRYLYYLGRIRAIQLEYTEAKEVLQQASRKAPSSALGFRVAVSKWLILVRLLLGEVPERPEFDAPGMRAPLAPYFALTAAVRGGDLAAFRAAAAAHAAAFASDRVTHIVTRLGYNVIRTGLRRINTAYSCISLQDVAAKLGLPSAQDAEYIAAKAIRDGGIDALLDHSAGTLRTRPAADLYSTAQPQAAFHARIAFCLDLHNEAVKAMRFEPDAHKRALAAAGGAKESISAEEIAAALEDEDDL